MPRIRRLLTWLSARLALLRYLSGVRQEGQTHWRRLTVGEAGFSIEDGPDVFVVSDPGVDEVKASRLAATVSTSATPIACGVLVRITDSPRNPLVVGAAGYEIGTDLTGPVALPVLGGVKLETGWSQCETTAPLASGPAIALTRDALSWALEKGWSLSDGVHALAVAVADHGPCLVNWSVPFTRRYHPVVPFEMDPGIAEERRHAGRGSTVELRGPTATSPGNPAPPPSALWVGEVQHARAAGHDTSELIPTVAIRHAATDWSVAELWGDHHFANALCRAFERRDIGVRVIPHHAWAHPFAARDLVITIRGLRRAEPVPGRVNVLWVISHPDDVTPEELDSHDLVAVASLLDVDRIQSMTSTPVIPLLQATDWTRFERPVSDDAEGVVFVGNSRGERRKSVMWAFEQGLDPMVAGYGWEGLLPPGEGAAPPVPNEQLPDVFNRFRVVLADHWEDMRLKGYISNRIFDVFAAGGLVVSDRVVGLTELLPHVPIYDSPEELEEVVRYWADPAHSQERTSKVEEVQAVITMGHTFDQRVRELLAAITKFVPVGEELVLRVRDAQGPG